MPSLRTSFAASAALLLALVPNGHAASLTAAEVATDQGILAGFNAVSFGNYTQNSETEGSALIGGNLSGNKSGDFCFQNCTINPVLSGTSYSSLTVFGTVSGTNGTGAQGANISIGNVVNGTLGAGTSATQVLENNYGGLNVAGALTGQVTNVTSLTTTGAQGSIKLQNPPPQAAQHYNQSAASVFPYGTSIAPVQQALSDLAAAGAALDQSLIGQGKGETLPANDQNNAYAPKANYSANGLNYAIVDAPSGTIASEQNWQGVNGAGLAAVIVVIDDTGNVTLPSVNPNSGESNVIYDFANATSVTTEGSWYGAILAPKASYTNNGITDGAVIADLISQNAEFHADLGWSGNLSGLPTGGGGTTSGGAPVPEPASMSLFGLGLLALSYVRRRPAWGASQPSAASGSASVVRK